MWREGMNYMHGTGHGVGSYLNVHEGPHQIRMEYVPAPLKAGMTVTDEPGLYLSLIHIWCWSFNTIRENMAAIAKAGYTIVQTSPAQRCVTEVSRDKGGGNQLFGHGKWYYQYQPTDWKIGNYQMGARDCLLYTSRCV